MVREKSRRVSEEVEGNDDKTERTKLLSRKWNWRGEKQIRGILSSAK